jgi:1,4-alpha-glucan branching enzyme
MASKKKITGVKPPIKRKRVILNFKAPNAKTVLLMGDFNQWNEKKHPMKKGPDGIWEKIIVLQPGRYEYRFLVDGRWENDPGNNQICTNSFGSSNNILEIT